jgi:phosphopantothenoylcysteine decarboxylase/phosphopantothenate--cysteine ligase
MLKDRRVLVGVSGGIAAYKAAELVRAFVKAGADVRVAMTTGAEKFITPLTLQSLSGHAVATDTFDLQQEMTPGSGAIGHIGLADWPEIAVVAPATADLLARLANGLANDVLTTVLLACRAPLLVAPAMNVNMWQHPATQVNMATLRARGVNVVGPDAGDLACGWVGAGRMAEPTEIAAVADRLLGGGDLVGRAVLVTAGPTYEAVDPVRFLGNRSTGKMGFAIAAAAARRGASVTLVAGPTALVTPPGVQRVDVESASQMRKAVLAVLPSQSVVVMAAAVADYRPAVEAGQKLKKEVLGDSPSLPLERNPDILRELASLSQRPLLVGFAAETNDVEQRAVEKRRAKGCELLVANNVAEKGSGFGTDTNRVLFVDESGTEWLPQLTKGEVAERIWDRVLTLEKK